MVREHKRRLQNGTVTTVKEHSRKASTVSSHLRNYAINTTISGPSYKDKLLKYELENGIPYSNTDSVISEIRSLKLMLHCTFNGSKVIDIQLNSVGLAHFEKYIGDIKDHHNRSFPLLIAHQRFVNLYLPIGVSIDLSCEAVDYSLSVSSIDL